MREYEIVYIVQPDATTERELEIHGRMDSAVEGGGGRLLLRDDWGKRKLAYEIRKFQKGHYFQANFLGDGKFVGEVERLLRIDADVLRFLVVVADENVADVESRIAEARKQEAERARRREERERIEAERERERTEAGGRDSDGPDRRRDDDRRDDDRRDGDRGRDGPGGRNQQDDDE